MTEAALEDREAIKKRLAYIDNLREMHRGKRLAGFVGCLLGVILMGSSAFVHGAPSWLRWVGLAVVVPSWLLFIYVLISRTQYVRTHPFDPEAS